MRPNILRFFLTAFLLLSGIALLQGQNTNADIAKPEPSAQSEKAQFFSGTVQSLDNEHIIVSRALVGKQPETRTFVIKPTTKVSKSVKAKTKVTVRYEHEEDDGDVALEIQLRSGWRFPRS